MSNITAPATRTTSYMYINIYRKKFRVCIDYPISHNHNTTENLHATLNYELNEGIDCETNCVTNIETIETIY